MRQEHGKKKISIRCTRIEHIDRIRKAYIMWEDIPICELYHEFSSLTGESDWAFKPIWDNWEKARERGEYVDIAGIDDTTHKDVYYRRNLPSFVDQRVVPEGREDLFPLLEEIHLTYNDLYEVLCRTHGVCGNDMYYVVRTLDEKVNIHQLLVPYTIPDFDTDSYGWLGQEVT